MTIALGGRGIALETLSKSLSEVSHEKYWELNTAHAERAVHDKGTEGALGFEATPAR